MQPLIEKNRVKTNETRKNYLGLKSFCGRCRFNKISNILHVTALITFHGTICCIKSNSVW